jgi:putative flippase GtrA
MRPTSIPDRLREVALFIGAGVVSNIIYFTALALLVMLFVEPLWLHAGIAYLLSAVINYLMHHTVTFRSTTGHGLAISRYIPVQGTALLMNSWLLDLLVSKGGFHYLLGQLVALLATTVWSYFANRNWVFSGRRFGG